MKRAVFFAASVFAFACFPYAAFAQTSAGGGFAGPQAGQGGSSATATVSQVLSFPNRGEAILVGNIVSQISGDRYLFRDSSGEVVIKISENRWWGLSVGPADLVEIGGRLRRESNGMIRYFDARSIRLAR